MSGRIEAKETPLVYLFSNFTFRIPDYQRPFSWNDDNFDDLFEDVSNAMDTDIEQYFIGSILLQKIDKNSYEIVDGQQRLTALTILLAVIRDKTLDSESQRDIQELIYQKKKTFSESPSVRRITPWDELIDLFDGYIYTIGGTKKFLDDNLDGKIKSVDQNDPRYHIYEAIKKFDVKLSDGLDIKQFLKYLLNKVYTVYIMTSSRTSAFHLFNVLNSRGLPLETSDLLKSENLGAIQDTITRDKYSRIWRDLEEELGRGELSNVIAFIRTIITKEKAKIGMYDEYQQIFKNGTLVKGTKFFDYLKKTADVYNDKILEAKLDSSDARISNEYRVTIRSMKRFIPYSDWIPTLLAYQLKFDSDNNLLPFLKKLEKKTILEWIVGYSPTERITSFNRIIKLIDEYDNSKEVIEKIELLSGSEIERQFVDKLDNTQFYSIYGGKLAKYLLLRIDTTFWDIESFHGYDGPITVEHVLPQKPSLDSEWTRNFSDDEREEWTSKLGNLVLLSGRKNSKARNYEFIIKKETYFGKKGTAFQITRKLQEVPDWNIEALRSRHEEMIQITKDLYLS